MAMAMAMVLLGMMLLPKKVVRVPRPMGAPRKRDVSVGPPFHVLYLRRLFIVLCVVLQ